MNSEVVRIAEGLLKSGAGKSMLEIYEELRQASGEMLHSEVLYEVVATATQNLVHDTPGATHQHNGPTFVMVPIDLIQDPLADPYTVTLYSVLRSYADVGNGTVAGAFPRHARLAELVGCTRGIVIDRLRRLRMMGWVEWIERRKEDGTQTSNLYTIHMVPKADMAEFCRNCGMQLKRRRRSIAGVCSRDCAKAFWAERRCKACDQPIGHLRKQARTCSKACRQKLSRKKTASGRGKSKSVARNAPKTVAPETSR